MAAATCAAGTGSISPLLLSPSVRRMMMRLLLSLSILSRLAAAAVASPMAGPNSWMVPMWARRKSWTSQSWLSVRELARPPAQERVERQERQQREYPGILKLEMRIHKAAEETGPVTGCAA